MFRQIICRAVSSSSSRSLLSSSLLRRSLPSSSLSSPSSSSLSSSFSIVPHRSFNSSSDKNKDSQLTEAQWEEEYKKAEKFLSESDPNERNHFILVGAAGAILCAATYQILSNCAKADDGQQEEEEEEQQEEGGVLEKIPGVKKFKEWNKPDDSVLLPPEQPDMFGKRCRTIVLGLHDLIIHAEWTRMDGWRTQKRPYYEEFIDRLMKSGWEIVLFSEKPSQEIDLLLQELDPSHKLKYRLSSESLTHKGYWKLEKDLSRLNRDPKRVLIVDWDEKYYEENSVNLLKVQRFQGDVKDNSLLQLADILEKVQKYNVYDVRDIVTKYNREQNPSTLFEAEEHQEKVMQGVRESAAAGQSNQNNPNQGKGAAWLGGLLGNTMKSGVRPGTAEGFSHHR